MDDSVLRMLEKYHLVTNEDYKNALKEIIQEMALFGLWRSKFFEHAAFYGGTALRILYGLDRFSEDLDFSLLSSDSSFDLKKYEEALCEEIESFGFSVSVENKIKNHDSAIQSAFIKANTLQHLIQIEIPEQIQLKCHADEVMKIKLEVDTDPPAAFHTESKALIYPFPFSIKSFVLPDLFAGKIHALLFRNWKNRVKGRDWYDFIWFLQKNIPVNLKHLENRMQQTQNWPSDQILLPEDLLGLLQKKISQLDIQLARNDIMPFLKDPRNIEVWSQHFFNDALFHLRFTQSQNPKF